MNIKIIILLLLAIFSFGRSFELTELKILEDKENIYNIKSILENKNLFKKTKKTNLGIKKYPIWTYEKIKNDTNEKARIVLTNPRAGIDFIDVFILNENQIIKTELLGDMRPQENREFVYRKSSFVLTLDANKEYEIYVKYKSFGAIDINWDIKNVFDYLSLITGETLVFGFVAGFVILFSIYILFINSIFPSISNKLYFGILICTILMEFSISGVLYQMGISIYLNTIISWSVGSFATALVGLFPIYFFNLKKIMPKSTITLYILSAILIGFSVIFLFYPLKNELLYLSPYMNLVFFILMIYLLYISINIYLKKIKGALFYLLANTLFSICIIYFLVTLLGFIKIGTLFYFSLGIGSILNVLFIGILIVERLLELRKEKENVLILLNEYTKLSNIGQSMINMSHQWKEPINHIYYAMNNISAAKEFKDPNLSQIIDNSLEQIKTTTTYMSKTGEKFLDLYADKKSIENIDLSNSISSSIKIFKSQIDSLNIKIITETKNKYTLYSDKYLISNIFLIILENAIKVFKSKNIKNPFIKIVSTKINKQIIITISDNAGGIKTTPINSIFEKDLTSLKSSGLGLFLAKNILTMKLDGEISVENTIDGACFKIIFNIGKNI